MGLRSPSFHLGMIGVILMLNFPASLRPPRPPKKHLGHTRPPISHIYQSLKFQDIEISEVDRRIEVSRKMQFTGYVCPIYPK